MNKLGPILEDHMKIIDEINKELKEFNVKINGYEKDLSLKNMNLNNDLLKKISLIPFKDLIYLDISGNAITDITCLNKMDLSKLKKFDASNNKIAIIEVLESVNLENLEELYLEKNKIEDVKVFLSKTLPKIKKICLENNNIKNDLKEIEKLEVKYGGKLNIRSLNYKQFNEKYESNISENSSFINITNKPYGDIVIRELFLINDNYVKLKNLTLMSCEIIDISYLSRIRFTNLEKLDLSDNKIEKIDVLADMRLDKLSDLFLHSNSIIDIYPLKFLKSKKLKTIGLNDNPILSDNYKEKNEKIIKYLKEKEIEVSLEIK